MDYTHIIGILSSDMTSKKIPINHGVHWVFLIMKIAKVNDQEKPKELSPFITYVKA